MLLDRQGRASRPLTLTYVHIVATLWIIVQESLALGRKALYSANLCTLLFLSCCPFSYSTDCLWTENVIRCFGWIQLGLVNAFEFTFNRIHIFPTLLWSWEDLSSSILVGAHLVLTKSDALSFTACFAFHLLYHMSKHHITYHSILGSCIITSLHVTVAHDNSHCVMQNVKLPELWYSNHLISLLTIQCLSEVVSKSYFF